jgi:hypothetical protein
VDTDLDTLATALYVVTDDLLADHPDQSHPALGSGSPRRSATPNCSLSP